MERKILYFQHPWSPNTLEQFNGFNEIARKSDWKVELVSDKIAERAFSQILKHTAHDGCVVARPLKTKAGLAAFHGCPTVFVNQPERKTAPSYEPWGFLTHDQAAISRLAVETFEKLHVSDFTYLPFKAVPRPDWCVRREAQFRKAVLDAGGRYVPFPRNLHELPHGCGVFAANDATAQRLLTHMRQIGLRVPQDALIIGVDNIEIVCDSTQPTLTSIRQGFPLSGKAVAEMLRDAMHARRRTLRLFSAATVVLRGSTDIGQGHDPRVADALAYIRENLSDTTLNVIQVADRMGCARRTADLVFTRETGRSIKREIMLKRLELACRLLANPRQKIGPIANLCGYASPIVFKRMFKSETGMTMRDWRKRRPA